MRCVKCGRPLGATPAATVKTRQGVSAWGPVCARRAGLIAAKPRQRSLKVHHQAPEVDPRQIPLELAA